MIILSLNKVASILKSCPASSSYSAPQLFTLLHSSLSIYQTFCKFFDKESRQMKNKAPGFPPFPLSKKLLFRSWDFLSARAFLSVILSSVTVQGKTVISRALANKSQEQNYALIRTSLTESSSYSAPQL